MVQLLLQIAILCLALVVVSSTTYVLKYNNQEVPDNSVVKVDTDSGTINPTCEASGTKDQVDISWEGEGIVNGSYEDDTKVKWHNGTFYKRSTLDLRIPQEEASKKEVTCIIAHSIQKETVRIKATFVREGGYSQPNVTEITAVMNEKITLPCKIGDVPYECIWFLANDEVFDSRQSENNPRYKRVGAIDSENCSLEIASVEASDRGEWKCQMGPTFLKITLNVIETTSSYSSTPHEGTIDRSYSSSPVAGTEVTSDSPGTKPDTDDENNNSLTSRADMKIIAGIVLGGLLVSVFNRGSEVCLELR